MSLSTYPSYSVLEDIGVLFTEALEIRDAIKGTHTRVYTKYSGMKL
jgi:hypothetical protein